MKILFILRSTIHVRRGGAEVQADFIRAACVAAGHEVHFAFDADSAVADPNDGTTYHRLPNRGRLGAWKNAAAINSLIASLKPDLVYQRVRFSYTGLAVHYGRKHGAKVVHGISSDIACRRNRVPFNRKLVSEWITEMLGRHGVTRADLLITQTTEQANDLRDHFQRDAITIPNGHPLPDQQQDKRDPPHIVWVASIKGWKQPDLFVELARRLNDTGATFSMAGKPTDAAFHQRFLASVNETPNLTYLGELSLTEVNTLLASATLFINTSQPREGFPNTFIQAWLRGTPVVSLHADPQNAIVQHGLGHLSGSLDQMEADVRALLANPDQLADTSQRAIDYATQTYDIELTAGRHLALFEELVREGAVTPQTQHFPKDSL